MENAIDGDYNFSVPLIVDANSAKTGMMHINLV